MDMIFSMLASVLDFFVDIGNRVDFMGMNMWGISIFVFCISLIYRWLFPLVFGHEFSGSMLSVADSVSRAGKNAVKSGGRSMGRLTKASYRSGKKK